jgi:phosphate transport system substrate-binding protein
MQTVFGNEGPGGRRVKLGRSVGLFVVGALMAGCPAGQQAPEATREARVTIKGSNTVGEELAPALIAEFKKAHPQAVIEVETRGSASGFWGLIAGVCDIAAASRPMVQDERQQAEVRGIKLNEYVIGAYSVAVIVNAGNPVAGLTRDQVRDVFTGAADNWKTVGGADAPIHLYIRNPISGTYLGFRELALQDQAYATNSVTELGAYSAIVDAVAKDVNGIGYAGFNLIGKESVKAVSIGGVAPTPAAVQGGQYPYARMLRLYTNKAREAPVARDFIQFILSARGQEIVSQMGCVPRR